MPIYVPSPLADPTAAHGIRSSFLFGYLPIQTDITGLDGKVTHHMEASKRVRS